SDIHLPNQITSLAIHWRPPSSRTPTPIEPEVFAVPSDYGRWLDQNHRLHASRPYPLELYPQQAIERGQSGTPRTLVPENAQLMAQSYDFQFQLCPAAEPVDDQGKGPNR